MGTWGEEGGGGIRMEGERGAGGCCGEGVTALVCCQNATTRDLYWHRCCDATRVVCSSLLLQMRSFFGRICCRSAEKRERERGGGERGRWRNNLGLLINIFVERDGVGCAMPGVIREGENN